MNWDARKRLAAELLALSKEHRQAPKLDENNEFVLDENGEQVFVNIPHDKDVAAYLGVSHQSLCTWKQSREFMDYRNERVKVVYLDKFMSKVADNMVKQASTSDNAQFMKIFLDWTGQIQNKVEVHHSEKEDKTVEAAREKLEQKKREMGLKKEEK
ncbi:phBC6A51 family helix-turn-helix protein [Alkalihalobacillus macyae]|uniref:phBC6A51 family helix-turn-helix protein n=1 Tax=Guptibacillus hwajinpoensis TaxID=208199 RepID=UPI00273C790D|nr:phBC6A51 family helix-turn-helix protein [Alkalihalobacillus macyae]MDP4549833.1 phBC6A51 family helix-turn-helix protein [Alkalihalobacillus macyae]